MTKVRIKPRILDVVEDDGMWLDQSTMTYYSKEDVEEVDLPSNLSEAADNFAHFYDNGTCDGIAQDCFIAGAKWQEKRDEESIKTAEDHAFLAGADWQKEQDDKLLNIAYMDGLQRGKEAEREQMMKGAVEGIARPDDCEIWVNLVGYGYKFNDGDKVKLIVIKED